ncbi:hypothetical protein [Actinoplanes sp. NPDC049316]|uniref:hypothetical protein n=1 Tax=Actinoplanes sp. NPDC049316 TaxID=3154727 RepID=UPI00341689FF
MSDCLRDLSWIPAERFIVIIGKAEEILVREANDRRTFSQFCSGSYVIGIALWLVGVAFPCYSGWFCRARMSV